MQLFRVAGLEFEFSCLRNAGPETRDAKLNIGSIEHGQRAQWLIT